MFPNKKIIGSFFSVYYFENALLCNTLSHGEVSFVDFTGEIS